MEQKIEKLISAFQINCKGSGENEHPCFEDDKAEPVIVKVYENGKSVPLCRYLEINCTVPRCNPDLSDKPEDKLGLCPYQSFQ